MDIGCAVKPSTLLANFFNKSKREFVNSAYIERLNSTDKGNQNEKGENTWGSHLFHIFYAQTLFHIALLSYVK